MKTAHSQIHISSPDCPSDRQSSISKGLLSVSTEMSHEHLGFITLNTELIVAELMCIYTITDEKPAMVPTLTFMS